MEYHYQPAKFDSTTEKQESYKHWDLTARPAGPPAPMRAILPFTGVPPLMTKPCTHTRSHAGLLAFGGWGACHSVACLSPVGTCSCYDTLKVGCRASRSL